MKSYFTGRGIAVIVALSFWCAHANTSSAAQPIAPAVAGSDYSVTYNNDYGAVSIDLYERYGSGSWSWVASGGGTVSFSGKPDGDYYYMTYELFVYYDEYWFPYYYYWSSPVTHVSVQGGPSVPPDSIATQSRYTYETRSGDIDGNGVADVFVRRTSGGAAGNGSIDTVILTGLGDGSFSSVVPSAYQTSIAQSWPILATQIVLKDFNLDGFMDIVLKELGNAIGGALGQIIVASGTASLAPQGVVAMNAKYTKFGQEVGNFIQDPNWYYYDAVANGRYTYVPIYVWFQHCIYYPYYDESGYYWDYYYCWWQQEIVDYYVVVDYSSYDQDGIQIANQIGVGADGWPVPDVAPGTAAARAIDQVLQRVFGVRFMKGQLDYPCTYALAYDSDTAAPCQYDVIGEILLAALASLTDRGACRPLTGGEISGGTGEGLVIFNVGQVRVCNAGFTIFGRSEIMAPDGHIYIGPTNHMQVPWSEDYSLTSVGPFSVLIHEMTHVYQVRSIGCNVFCMGVAKGISLAGAGYDYTPFTPGYIFHDYNIEQQAQMVQDRFLIRRGYLSAQLGTRDATLPQLNQVIPF